MSIQPVNKAVCGAGGGGSVNAYLMKNSKRQTETDRQRQRQTDGQRLFSCFTKTRSLCCGDYSSAFLFVVRGLIVSDHLHFAHICFSSSLFWLLQNSLFPCPLVAETHQLTFCRPPSTTPGTLVLRNVDQSN